MPYAFHYDVPGDEHIYGKVNAEIGEERPKGLLVHMVEKREGAGLRHFNVWESREDWERFRDQRVQPAVTKVLAGMGVTDAPRPSEIEMDLIDLTAVG